MTTAKTNHLTSFGTGFFPQPNKIDFEFVFANNCNDTDDNLEGAPKINNCFADNLTIFLLLIISFMFYFIGMIWAIVKDNKDDKAVSTYIFFPFTGGPWLMRILVLGKVALAKFCLS